MAKYNCYAVKTGRKPGIYSSYDEAQAQVKGFPGNQHKGFESLKEAEAFIRGETSSTGASNVRPQFIPDYTVYVDGSCKPNPGASGIGLVAYLPGDNRKLYYGGFHQASTNQKAELIGLNYGLRFAKKRAGEGFKTLILTDSEYAINSVNDGHKGSKSNKRKSKIHVDLINKCKSLYKGCRDYASIEHVSAHSGIDGNGLADKLAKIAVEEGQVKIKEAKAVI